MKSLSFTVEPIGYVHSPYPQKFGVARQPGLVPAAQARIELLPSFGADSVRGLADFDYVWVQFVFHDAINEGWSALVRPPRLGGKQKMGVFATRSPHRPNHLGLSLLKLLSVDTHKNVVLHLEGVDLLDGTPVLDIKPYIPFIEAKPDAKSGFVTGAPPTLTVGWQAQAQAQCEAYGLDCALARLIEQSIAQDPRPAYQNTAGRIYVMRIDCVDVSFRIDADAAWITDVVLF